MKLPLSWLKDFVEIEHKPEKLAEELLLSGTKVEETAKSGEDYVFDLEITSNRADCLSIYGLSREVSAISNKTLRDFSTNPVSGENETPGFEINISNKSNDVETKAKTGYNTATGGDSGCECGNGGGDGGDVKGSDDDNDAGDGGDAGNGGDAYIDTGNALSGTGWVNLVTQNVKGIRR